MSIDISCYVKSPEIETQEILDKFINDNTCILQGFYKFSGVSKIYGKNELENISDRVERYLEETNILMAEEFGFNGARSMFVIYVLDKTFSGINIPELVVMLKNIFGEKNILALFEGETAL